MSNKRYINDFNAEKREKREKVVIAFFLQGI
jgi:hypothetical protein